MTLFGQTCCSGGVPISGNIGFPISNEKEIQYGISFENNILKSLFSGNERLSDNNRKRTTQSLILRSSYNAGKHLNLEVFVPFIKQSRKIRSNAGDYNKESSLGLGDPLLLLGYSYSNAKFNWIVSSGIKIPLGSNTETNDQGLLLVNDMQVGSGAFDGIFRSAIEIKGLGPTSRITNALVYNLRGTNSEYLNTENYKFGNEIQLISSYSDQLFFLGQNWIPNLTLRFRKAQNDKFNDQAIFSTGGEWLFIKLGLGLATSYKSQIIFSYETTIHTNVNGTQISPSYIINIGFFNKLKMKS